MNSNKGRNPLFVFSKISDYHWMIKYYPILKSAQTTIRSTTIWSIIVIFNLYLSPSSERTLWRFVLLKDVSPDLILISSLTAVTSFVDCHKTPRLQKKKTSAPNETAADCSKVKLCFPVKSHPPNANTATDQ